MDDRPDNYPDNLFQMGARFRAGPPKRCNTWWEENGFLIGVGCFILFCVAMGPIGNKVLTWLQ